MQLWPLSDFSVVGFMQGRRPELHTQICAGRATKPDRKQHVGEGGQKRVYQKLLQRFHQTEKVHVKSPLT